MLKKSETIEENITKIPTKKRGRKSKKELEDANKALNKKPDNLDSNISENIVVTIEENDTFKDNDTVKENDTINDNIISCINEVIYSDKEYNTCNSDVPEFPEKSDEQSSPNKPVTKKRGRKPKGGKIIQQIIQLNNVKETKPNVILHLKCSLKDLKSTNLFGSNLDGYSFSHPNNLYFDTIHNENDNFNDIINSSTRLSDYEGCFDTDTTDFDVDTIKNKDKDNDIRDIWKKLKLLEHNLHINNIENKKSACFWDTCEFDNPPVYIPKHFINDTYQVYGCFCSPECAVAHLMEENIDSSIKFERYQLMNHIYSKVYNYNKNIKPAPNPYYMLEKYYGNLTIQEFRSLLRSERLFLVVDKPLTRVMPELHEDNDDFIINNKIIPTNNIKLRKLQKKQTKTNILSERFGLAQN
jgi:hypothetical protein